MKVRNYVFFETFRNFREGNQEWVLSHFFVSSGCLRYVEKNKNIRSLQYVENGSLHNVEFLQALQNVETMSLQYVEKLGVSTRRV